VLALWLNLIDHHRALSRDYPVLPDISSVIASEVRRAASRDSCRLFVAELEQRLVGFLFAEIEGGGGPDAEPAPAWVHELWVEPKYRKQGIAARLLAESDAFFASRRVSRVSVRVESSNTAALEFWARLGFGERARILERVS
jgi:ribosomal protein S18 acetylase RimI-like enzyme